MLNIKEVILFPTLRPKPQRERKLSEQDKEIIARHLEDLKIPAYIRYPESYKDYWEGKKVTG